MKEHYIIADVYARWGDKCPTYRIYVDNNLLTERDFIWQGHEIYIKENIIVNLEPGTHKLEIQQTNSNGSISIKNVLLDGQPSSCEFIT
jgi:hypothetical protein